ncbi:hypothetical protein P5673_026184, partial [Acropora cervicornis]
ALSRLREIQEAIELDTSLKKPTERARVLEVLRPHYCVRDKLSVQDGVIFRGQRIVIPTTLRTEMKTKVHALHRAIKSCLP